MRSGKHCIDSKTALQPVMIANLRRPPFGKAFAIIAVTAIITMRIHFLWTTARHHGIMPAR